MRRPEARSVATGVVALAAVVAIATVAAASASASAARRRLADVDALRTRRA